MHPDVKPRSMEWCLKLIDSLFKSKRLKVGLTIGLASWLVETAGMQRLVYVFLRSVNAGILFCSVLYW